MITINESFICVGCGKQVFPATKTCRNHCPWCFTSLHVDGNIPGDRATSCHGVMKPIELDFKMSGGSRILFECTVCHKTHRNKVADDDRLEDLQLSHI